MKANMLFVDFFPFHLIDSTEKSDYSITNSST